MAYGRSAILEISLCVVVATILTSSSSFAHPYTSNDNSGGDDHLLPTSAKLRVLGTLFCGLPRTRPQRSEPLVAGVDVVVRCGDHRIAAAQIVSDRSGVFDCTMDLVGEVLENPLFALQECRVLASFLGNACFARLELVGDLVDGLLGHLGSDDHQVPMYEAKDFKPYY